MLGLLAMCVAETTQGETVSATSSPAGSIALVVASYTGSFVSAIKEWTADMFVYRHVSNPIHLQFEPSRSSGPFARAGAIVCSRWRQTLAESRTSICSI